MKNRTRPYKYLKTESISAFELGKVNSQEGEIIAPHQYTSTNSLLKDFLETNHIFKPHFTKPDNVKNFYKNIRCGLCNPPQISY
jgi:hypothetical protein